MSLDFAANWTQVLSFIIPVVGGFVVWAIKHWIFDLFRDKDQQVDGRLSNLELAVVAIKTSLDKPNGGSSVRDSLNRIEQGNLRLMEDLAHLKGRFDQHMEDGR